MKTSKEEVIEKLSSVYKEYDPSLCDDGPGFYVRYIVDTYGDEFEAFVKELRTDPLPLMDVVCSVDGFCPTCDTAVSSAKGVTLLPEDIIDAELTDGLNAYEKAFVKRYDEKVCLFQYRCPCCGNEWKSVDAYADLEEIAFFLSAVDRFMAEKGIRKEEIENYMGQECDDYEFPPDQYTMGLASDVIYLSGQS